MNVKFFRKQVHRPGFGTSPGGCVWVYARVDNIPQWDEGIVGQLMYHDWEEIPAHEYIRNVQRSVGA